MLSPFRLSIAFFFLAVAKSQGKKVAIGLNDRATVYLELVDAHMEAGQLVRN